MEGTESDRSGEEVVAEGEGEHEEGGGKGEAEPCGESSRKAAAQKTEGEADLAAGGAGEGLGEGDDFGVGFFAAPGAVVNELALEVAEVGDGAAEAGAAEAKKDWKNFGPGVRAPLRGHGGSVPQVLRGRRELRAGGVAGNCLAGLVAGGAFEGAGDVGRDPAAVKVAGLGDDAFAVDGALVDAVGVEGDVVAQVGVGG